MRGCGLHIFRSRLLWRGHWYERLRLCNYGLTAITLTLTFDFAADYADLFEVRGVSRDRRGAAGPARVDEDRVELVTVVNLK